MNDPETSTKPTGLPNGRDQQARCIRLTVQLLDGLPVVLREAVAGDVLHRALVVRPHDGRLGRGVGEPQGMAKLVHRHREQVNVTVRPCGGRSFELSVYGTGLRYSLTF